MEDALIFAGVDEPDLLKTSNIHLNFGHIHSIEGDVIKGQSIGEVVGYGNYHPKIAYKVYISYAGIVYDLSPTLFDWDVSFVCHPDSWYDCEPESHDYAP